MKNSNQNLLRRYTDVTSLLHILMNKKITLLNPNTWDDKNDSKFIQFYKEAEGYKSILALCFTEAPETYHHWKVFSPGNSGVCIRFHKDRLLNCFEENHFILHDKVIYKTIDELKNSSSMIVDDLPFLKRYPFRDEEEYRAIYISNRKNAQSQSINIELSCISTIVLSPWLPKILSDTLKKSIKSIDGCDTIKIIKTGLNENKEWIRHGRKIV